MRNCFWLLGLASTLAIHAVHAQAPAAQQPTNPPAEYFPIDLSKFVTTVFSNAPAGNIWGTLPRGEVKLEGIPFKIDGKFEVTGMDAMRNGNELIPPRVAGIPIGRRAEKLVLLHGTGWTEKDGEPMAKLVLHYANGEQRALRIAYGVHARNWYEDRNDNKRKGVYDPNSVVAWSANEDDPDRSSPLRFYRTTFGNPLPSEEIRSIDVVSLFSHSTPIILGLTLQNGGGAVKTVAATAPRRIIKKAMEKPDEAYNRTVKVRAVTSESGDLLTNSTLFATLADEQYSYPWGAYKSDSQGILSVEYPPHRTLSLSLLVKSPNRAPLFLSPKRGKDGEFGEIRAKLEQGPTVGGVVQDEAGKPVGDAEVLISSVSRVKSRNYTQIDYDQVRTDSSGRWKSSSLPHNFSNLVVFVSHPEHRGSSYHQPDTNSVASATNKPAKINSVTADDLLASKAVMIAPRGLLVQGIVKDNAGKAVANAQVYFFENLNVAKTKRMMRTRDDGRFSFVATAETGEAAVAAVANGFAGRYDAFFLEPSLKAFDLALNSGSEVKARVIDNEQQPVVGATVKLEQWHNTQVLQFQTETDAEGRFTWASAPEGPLQFSLSKSNYFMVRTSMSASSGESTLTMRKMSNASGLVVDAETKKPIDEFSIIKGHSYSPGEPIRWNRYGYTPIKGRNGRYSVRLDDYYNGQSKIMIEAPGYLPVASMAFTKPGWYTNNFELKKGKGSSGTIVLASGEPVANCSVVQVDPGNSMSLDQTGEFRSGSGNADITRTDAQGKFQFPPKAEIQTIMAGHDKGFAQIQSDRLPADGKITLGPWGHVTGTLKVGPKEESGKMAVLSTFNRRYGEAGRRNPALSLYLRAQTDAEGNFAFHKVPPGDRMIGALHEIRTSNGSRSSMSHSIPVAVGAGQTNVVTVGGTGRTITGRITIAGGEASDVDWKRDLQSMSLRLAGNPELEPAIMPANLTTQEEQQKFWQDRNERMRVFWQSEKGRELELKSRSYVLMFETNGTFRVHNVPAGTYDLYINLTDPTDEDGSYRQIGSLSKQLTIPEGTEPFDTGSHELRIRRALRIGQLAPAFEAKSLDGKNVKLQDFRGKHVLMNFHAKWSGTQQTTELQSLKSLSDSFGKEGRLVIIGLSVDYEEKTARDHVTENGIQWPVCYLGQWSQTQVPATFGVEGIPHSILIGPDGKIVAKNLQGTYMRTAVRNALQAKTASTVRNLP